MSDSVLIVNGPNLNMLGSREPEIYGRETLADIEKKCRELGKSLGLNVLFFQSNHEGEIVTKLQKAVEEFDGIIINAGALTHTSVAILDALLLHKGPVLEVHLSNIFRREPFRHHSYVSMAAMGMICGLGSEGYLHALTSMKRLLDK
jgi:3-dehydroquinate dehydratase-2